MPSANSRPFVIIGIGIIVGVMAGFFGVGGGLIMVPLLMLALAFDQRRASATSLSAIIATATVAAAAFVLSGSVPWSQIGFGLIIAVGSVSTAPLGAKALRTWNVRLIQWLFIGMLAVTAIMVFVTLPQRESHFDWNPSTVALLIGIGALMGFVAGLLGVGGGIIVVPLLVLLGVSDLTAKTLSLVAMVPAAVSGTISSTRAGLVEWRTALPLGIVTAASTPLGVWFAIIFPREWANPLLATLIVYAIIELSRRNITESRRG